MRLAARAGLSGRGLSLEILRAGDLQRRALIAGEVERSMEILLPAERIQQRVTDLARAIAADYRGQSAVTIVGVLTGSLMFLADLVRHLDFPLRIGLIQASSYRGATTTPSSLRIAPDLAPDLRNRHVLLL